MNDSYDVPIVVVGAGPVGMLLAFQLDRLNVPFLLAEQSLNTTKWPKMDLTNCRSLEILRVLGLADEYRAQEGCVSQDANFDSIFVSHIYDGGKLLGAWRQPSVNVQRSAIQQKNDGSQAAEPGQRCTQIIFEAWMKKLITSKSHIQSKFGWKYHSHEERENAIITTFVDTDGKQHTVRSKYLVACDGGGSRVRKNSGIGMTGGPMPVRFYLVHFRSQQLARERPHGRFWHCFPAHGGFVLDQDDDDTFTAHFPVDQLPPGDIDPREVVYWTLGGLGQKHVVKIDEILVHSAWTPNFSVANQYHNDSLRVVLAGDAAHRNPPHGGYGMNSGVVDAFDLGWRLAALVKGYGGDLLIRSYNLERRPMMIRALQRAHRHAMEHLKLASMLPDDKSLLDDDTREGEAIRRKLSNFLDESGHDTLDRGIELDLRYHSPIIYQDGTAEPEWKPERYLPSTRPGSRAPHVFLKDGKTSTYDLFGAEWTLFHFVDDEDSGSEQASEIFSTVAGKLSMPLKRVIVRHEPHVQKIWEVPLVLVRPDTHVAWRGSVEDLAKINVEEVLRVVSGQIAFKGYQPVASTEAEESFKQLVAPLKSNDNSQSSIAQENA